MADASGISLPAPSRTARAAQLSLPLSVCVASRLPISSAGHGLPSPSTGNLSPRSVPAGHVSPRCLSATRWLSPCAVSLSCTAACRRCGATCRASCCDDCATRYAPSGCGLTSSGPSTCCATSPCAGCCTGAGRGTRAPGKSCSADNQCSPACAGRCPPQRYSGQSPSRASHSGRCDPCGSRYTCSSRTHKACPGERESREASPDTAGICRFHPGD